MPEPGELGPPEAHHWTERETALAGALHAAKAEQARLRSCLRQEQDLSNEMHGEIERLKAEHSQFVEQLTEALAAHGVPACSSWRVAIDYLAYHGGRERNA